MVNKLESLLRLAGRGVEPITFYNPEKGLKEGYGFRIRDTSKGSTILESRPTYDSHNMALEAGKNFLKWAQKTDFVKCYP